MAFTMSGTSMQMWCSPSPRFSSAFFMGLSSPAGQTSSMRPAPWPKMATFTFSLGTCSISGSARP